MDYKNVLLLQSTAISECTRVIEMESFAFDLCACVDKDECLCDILVAMLADCALHINIQASCQLISPKCPQGNNYLFKYV